MRRNVEKSKRLIDHLVRIVGSQHVLSTRADLESYSKDMADYEAHPLAVVRPSSEGELAKIIKLANRYRAAVVAWGAGSSLTGAVVTDGIMIDMQRFNRILRVDPINWYAHVQSGVVLEDLNKDLESRGFFFPPDPASSFMCTVGGAISEGSGGMRCVKYGTMKDWVLAVRIVLPNGIPVTLGEPLPKNRAGYDLVRLIVGSEGTLGIVTDAWLKIIPKPTSSIQRILALFDTWKEAGRAIQELRVSRIIPSLAEFMDRESLLAVNKALQLELPEAEAALLIDVEADGKAEEIVSNLLSECGAKHILRSTSAEDSERLYNARAYAYIALKSLGLACQAEDVVVPIDRLVEYLELIKSVSQKYRLRIGTVGHAGDGNVHPNILYDSKDPASRRAATGAFEEICKYAIRVGGTISGEHGIGLQKVKFLRQQIAAHNGAEVLKIMKAIKKVFDPSGVMNPGKYVELS